MRREPKTPLRVRAFDLTRYLGSEERGIKPRYTRAQLLVLSAGTIGLLHALAQAPARVVKVSRAYSDLHRRRFPARA